MNGFVFHDTPVMESDSRIKFNFNFCENCHFFSDEEWEKGLYYILFSTFKKAVFFFKKLKGAILF